MFEGWTWTKRKPTESGHYMVEYGINRDFDDHGERTKRKVFKKRITCSLIQPDPENNKTWITLGGWHFAIEKIDHIPELKIYRYSNKPMEVFQK